MNNSISLCMIVKDEQKFLPYVLYSIRDIVDEIIIIDSGSTDRTIEIAQAFNSYVIAAPWVNSFSHHRNISTSVATKEWILWMDADEIFLKEDVWRIKNILTKINDVDFWIMNRYNFWKDLNFVFSYPDSQYKMYRNHKGYRWKNPIHEIIYDRKNSNHVRLARQSDVHIFHYAYTKSPQEVAAKMQHYIEIENPHMDKEKIKKCSTEHSYFSSALPPEVTRFTGKLPQVFNELQVTNTEIRTNKGEVIWKFKKYLGKPSQSIIFEKDYVSEARNKTKQTNLPKYNNFFRYEINDAIKNSICIATYNQWDKLKRCVESIYQNTHLPFEILIAANSDVPDENILKDLESRFSNLRVFRLGNNYGFAKGYNYLASQAFGKNLVILNDDTEILTDGWLKKLQDYFYSTLDCGMVGIKSNNNPSENGGFENGPKANWNIDQCREWLKNNKLDTGLMESSWVTAMCLFLNRDIIKALDNVLFCEAFQRGEVEDTDLVFRVQHKIKSINDLPRRSRLYITKDVFLYHYGQCTLKTFPDQQEIHDKNMEILKARWPEMFK